MPDKCQTCRQPGWGSPGRSGCPHTHTTKRSCKNTTKDRQATFCSTATWQGFAGEPTRRNPSVCVRSFGRLNGRKNCFRRPDFANELLLPPHLAATELLYGHKKLFTGTADMRITTLLFALFLATAVASSAPRVLLQATSIGSDSADIEFTAGDNAVSGTDLQPQDTDATFPSGSVSSTSPDLESLLGPDDDAFPSPPALGADTIDTPPAADAEPADTLTDPETQDPISAPPAPGADPEGAQPDPLAPDSPPNPDVGAMDSPPFVDDIGDSPPSPDGTDPDDPASDLGSAPSPDSMVLDAPPEPEGISDFDSSTGSAPTGLDAPPELDAPSELDGPGMDSPPALAPAPSTISGLPGGSEDLPSSEVRYS